MDEVVVIVYDYLETTGVPMNVRAGWVRVAEAWARGARRFPSQARRWGRILHGPCLPAPAGVSGSGLSSDSLCCLDGPVDLEAGAIFEPHVYLRVAVEHVHAVRIYPHAPGERCEPSRNRPGERSQIPQYSLRNGPTSARAEQNDRSRLQNET